MKINKRQYLKNKFSTYKLVPIKCHQELEILKFTSKDMAKIPQKMILKAGLNNSVK